MDADRKLKLSLDRQLAQSIEQSQEALQILSKLSTVQYSSLELSECLKSEIESLAADIKSMVADLKEASIKALTLYENASSLTNSKANIKKFNQSLERFKSLSTQPRAEKL